METNQVRNELARRLKTLREETGFSQAKLAEEIGVSRGSINYYESSERTAGIDFLHKSAEYFKCSTDYLLGISDFRNDEEKNTLLVKEDMIGEKITSKKPKQKDIIYNINDTISLSIDSFPNDDSFCENVLTGFNDILNDFLFLSKQIDIATSSTQNDAHKWKLNDVKKYIAFIVASFDHWEKMGIENYRALYKLYKDKMFELIPKEFIPSSSEIGLMDLNVFFDDDSDIDVEWP